MVAASGFCLVQETALALLLLMLEMALIVIPYLSTALGGLKLFTAILAQACGQGM
jgi:hypothetical protein